ncbi:MAG: hypothetical protein JO205_09530 [Pseudolabrys sp.]|nr:hypothetical protein [Pseudolabrys sp.]
MATTTDADIVYPRVQATIKSVTNWVRRARHSRGEFSEFSPEDVAAIARDLGMTAGELRQLAKQGPESSDLLLRRMALLHLDPHKLALDQPGTMHDLQKLCSLCTSHKRCQRDLLHDPDDTIWKGYCPNTDTLDALGKKPQA